MVIWDSDYFAKNYYRKDLKGHLNECVIRAQQSIAWSLPRKGSSLAVSKALLRAVSSNFVKSKAP